MSGYTLTWHAETPAAWAIDGAQLAPDRLAGLGPDELADVELAAAGRRLPLARVFRIAGEPGSSLTVRGAPPLDRLGAGMRSGQLAIAGDAGDDLGAGMRGGRIAVHGSAGDRVAGPLEPAGPGARGGTIHVAGDAGAHAALRMRRGLVGIGGACGPSPALRMLAGTLAVGSGPIAGAGREMQRGTVLALEPAKDDSPPAAFRRAGVFPAGDLVALRLILRSLRAAGMSPAGDENDAVALYRGDRFETNKGEIFQWLSRA